MKLMLGLLGLVCLMTVALGAGPEDEDLFTAESANRGFGHGGYGGYGGYGGGYGGGFGGFAGGFGGFGHRRPRHFG
ncbi:unnamed protein product [Darwinula stevensoni]|uniref:Glycine-rich protein n=1 Tax=Darwinula stevensoni TaxID=69355 RepID=A0A7R9AGL1_9CRUS|nr:unnamed protein product [Darwinula stevensoni]CAG0904460.1 unnamed protein product [Darwinula stevensoni]